MLKMQTYDLNMNVFKELEQNWALVVAGGKNGSNPMTVSWGGMGILWGKKVCFIFIRPQRYTYEFLKQSDRFTLNFFNGNYKDNLLKAGRITGKGIDKYKEVGFTPIYDIDHDLTYVKEASYVFKLKKLYVSDFKEESFIDKSIIDANYPNKDFHHVIIAEITNVLYSEELDK